MDSVTIFIFIIIQVINLILVYLLKKKLNSVVGEIKENFNMQTLQDQVFRAAKKDSKKWESWMNVFSTGEKD